MTFQPLGPRAVHARFAGGAVTSAGGARRRGEAERRTGALPQCAACFTDHRDPDALEHTVGPRVRQRVSGLALGYEDLHAPDPPRLAPWLATWVGTTDPTGQDRRRAQDQGTPWAGKRTRNRRERTPPAARAARRSQQIGAQPEASERVVVD